MDFCEKLVLLRQQHGDTQRALAAALGKHENQIIRFERPGTNSEPSFDNLVTICRRYGVTADWLVDKSKDWPPPFREDDAMREIHRLVVLLGPDMARARLLGLQAPHQATNGTAADPVPSRVPPVPKKLVRPNHTKKG